MDYVLDVFYRRGGSSVRVSHQKRKSWRTLDCLQIGVDRCHGKNWDRGFGCVFVTAGLWLWLWLIRSIRSGESLSEGLVVVGWGSLANQKGLVTAKTQIYTTQYLFRLSTRTVFEVSKSSLTTPKKAFNFTPPSTVNELAARASVTSHENGLRAAKVDDC